MILEENGIKLKPGFEINSIYVNVYNNFLILLVKNLHYLCKTMIVFIIFFCNENDEFYAGSLKQDQ